GLSTSRSSSLSCCLSCSGGTRLALASGVLLGLLVLWPLACGRDDVDAPREAGSSSPEAVEGCTRDAVRAVEGEERRIEVGGVERRSLLDVPAGPGDQRRPVVIGFHGFDGTGARFRRRSRLGRFAHEKGFIALFPDGRDGVERRGREGRGWDVGGERGPDAALVERLIEETVRTQGVHRDRIFAVGLSTGRQLANGLGCLMAGRLAGVAAVAGSSPLAVCENGAPVAVVLIHGRNDGSVPLRDAREARDWWRARNECGDSRRDR